VVVQRVPTNVFGSGNRIDVVCTPVQDLNPMNRSGARTTDVLHEAIFTSTLYISIELGL
jgi:hypothetical protein